MAEEQRACAVCGTETVHYDGACEQCLMRKQQSSTVTAPTRSRGRLPIKIGALLLLLVLVLAVLLTVGAGFEHIVHGGGVGLKLCAKESWSLSDTFVDANDFIGKPWIELLDREPVVRALERCELLERPRFPVHRPMTDACLNDPLHCDP